MKIQNEGMSSPVPMLQGRGDEGGERQVYDACFPKELTEPDSACLGQIRMSGTHADAGETGRGQTLSTNPSECARIGTADMTVVFVDENARDALGSNAPQITILAHFIEERLRQRRKAQTRNKPSEKASLPHEVTVELRPRTVGQAAEVRLNHPDIGPVKILLHLIDDRLSIDIEVTTGTAAATVTGAETELRQAMHEQGFPVERFFVRRRGAEGPRSRKDITHVLDEEA